MGIRIVSAVLLIVFAALPGYTSGSPLRAGVAVVEITPPPKVKLPAYEGNRRAEGVHDPLFARVLLLRTKDTSLALITSDLHRIYSPALAIRIRREFKIDHTILSASHSFSAPSLDEEMTDWARATQAKIFQAVHKANQGLFSAEISWGRGALIGAHNIRIAGRDGTVRERWSAPEEVTAPIDPSVTVIRIDDESGVLKAVLVHYSCEPAIAGPDQREISADYPGAAARYVERELGVNVICLFALGAAATFILSDRACRAPMLFLRSREWDRESAARRCALPER
jgi:neutral ceramidase